MANAVKIGKTTIHVGDTVDVHYRLIEKEKIAGKAKRETKEEVHERIQVFEGIVIKIRGEAENASFTIRRIGVGAIGIERIFPVHSPWIKGITVKKKGKVRRAKLYYLRDQAGHKAERLKEELREDKIEPETEPQSEISGKGKEMTDKKAETSIPNDGKSS